MSFPEHPQRRGWGRRDAGRGSLGRSEVRERIFKLRDPDPLARNEQETHLSLAVLPARGFFPSFLRVFPKSRSQVPSKSIPPPNSLQTKVVPHYRSTLFGWDLAVVRRLSASELLGQRVSRGREAGGGSAAPRWSRLSLPARPRRAVVSIREDAPGCQESASVHRKG